MSINSRTEKLSHIHTHLTLERCGEGLGMPTPLIVENPHIYFWLSQNLLPSVSVGLAPEPPGHWNAVLPFPGWGDTDPPTQLASAPADSQPQTDDSTGVSWKNSAETWTSAVQTCVVPGSPETCNTMDKSQNMRLKENSWKSTRCVSMTF